jgi:hypothetical protein
MGCVYMLNMVTAWASTYEEIGRYATQSKLALRLNYRRWRFVIDISLNGTRKRGVIWLKRLQIKTILNDEEIQIILAWTLLRAA